MTSTAPIILFVYNRLLHTQQVIAALKANLLSQDSELYIYSDAPKDAAALDQVNALRNYLTTITGFKNVHISLRDENLGVDENVIQGVTEVINKHGKAIVLEDDLVTNIGHDDTGIHCVLSTDNDVVLAQSAVAVATDTLPDPVAFLAFSDFFKDLSAKQKRPVKGVLSKSFKEIKTAAAKLFKSF